MNVRVHSSEFKCAALLGQSRVLILTSWAAPNNLGDRSDTVLGTWHSLSKNLQNSEMGYYIFLLGVGRIRSISLLLIGLGARSPNCGDPLSVALRA